jgi:hypothetical protein
MFRFRRITKNKIRTWILHIFSHTRVWLTSTKLPWKAAQKAIVGYRRQKSNEIRLTSRPVSRKRFAFVPLARVPLFSRRSPPPLQLYSGTRSGSEILCVECVAAERTNRQLANPRIIPMRLKRPRNQFNHSIYCRRYKCMALYLCAFYTRVRRAA